MRKAIVVPVLMLLASGMASFGQSNTNGARYHELIPLGAQTFTVQAEHWHGVLALLASAQSPQFDGMQATDLDRHPRLVAADGKPLSHYPSVVFRLTASFRASFSEIDPFHVTAAVDRNDYLLKLKFRIIAFHGLRQTVIAPAAVEMIGVPSSMPYDERIYTVTVNLQNVPIADRVVFEVFDPAGARLTKFHLDLM